MRFSEEDVARLSAALRMLPARPKGEDYGWPGNTALTVLDCVLSLHRPYNTFVLPRVEAFREHHPEVTNLTQLNFLVTSYVDIGQFSRENLKYRDVARENTLRGIIAFLLTRSQLFDGVAEWDRLKAWAMSVRPNDCWNVPVRGFRLAGFQYLRMLFGVQTAKPDVHIVRYVSDIVQSFLSPWNALVLLELAAAEIGLPLRQADRGIWKTGARPVGRPSNLVGTGRRWG